MRPLLVIVLVLFPLVSATQDLVGDITYQLSQPVDGMTGFINTTSFRGVGIQARKFVNSTITLGGSLNWNIFHQVTDGTAEIPNGHVTGIQNKTLNMIPLYMSSCYYYLQKEKLRGYGGLNLGLAYSIRRHDIGVTGFEEKLWHLAAAPEIGFIFKSGNQSFTLLSLRWNIAFESQDRFYSYLNISIGFMGSK